MLLPSALTARSIVATFLLASIIPAHALSVREVFTVATGDVPGSCDDHKELDAQFKDTLKMSRAALSTIKQVIPREIDYSRRRMLFSMFGINSGPYVRYETDQLEAGDEERIEIIEVILVALQSTFYLESLKPRLYCDGNFLVWTTKAMDPNTGKPTDRPISDDLPGVTGAYWYNEKKAYVKDLPPEAGEGGQPCEGDVMGFTSRQHNTITLCPQLFTSPEWRQRLPLPSEVKAGDSLYDRYKSAPGAWLHELAHMVVGGTVVDQPAFDDNGNKIDGQYSYGFHRCYNLATKDYGIGNPANPLGQDRAILNADTYHIFALASYLDQWDWADGVAAPLKDPRPYFSLDSPLQSPLISGPDQGDL